MHILLKILSILKILEKNLLYHYEQYHRILKQGEDDFDI